MNATDLIKEFEGCKLEAYLDSRDIPTIGWGSTGKDIYIGLKWTQEQCDDRLNTDILFVSNQVRGLLKQPANENQVAAMVSLAYNIGLGNFRKSSVLLKFNQGDTQGAADAFLLWDKITDKNQHKSVLEGLFERRTKERTIFLS